jgi:hypothetical protein
LGFSNKVQISITSQKTKHYDPTNGCGRRTKCRRLISYQLAIDPAGKKKKADTFQFCELVTGTCGRVASMRAGKWGSDSPQFGIGKTLVQAVVQVKFYCPVAAVAYLGQVIL